MTKVKDINGYERMWLTQYRMVKTLVAMCNIILVSPHICGIYDMTYIELEDWIHMIRTEGYLLGIDDTFNLCYGTPDEVRQLSRLLYNHVVEENNYIKEGVEMSDMMAKSVMGRSNSFLCYVNKFNPDLIKTHQKLETLYEHLFYYLLIIIFYLISYKIFRKFINFLFKMFIPFTVKYEKYIVKFLRFLYPEKIELLHVKK